MGRAGGAGEERNATRRGSGAPRATGESQYVPRQLSEMCVSIHASGVEEFHKRLMVHGVGATPLSFLLPDLRELLEGAAPAPREDLVVLPPCLSLDTVLQPELVVLELSVCMHSG